VKRILVLLAAATILAPYPAYADQIRFTGQTTADETLIQDALRNVMLIAAAEHCTSLEGVQAKILSPGYKPAATASRPEGENATYEAWTATLCGKPTKFLITFWPAEDGGTMLAVGYPYPKGAP
jgi:hypothetical protein